MDRSNFFNTGPFPIDTIELQYTVLYQLFTKVQKFSQIANNVIKSKSTVLFISVYVSFLDIKMFWNLQQSISIIISSVNISLVNTEGKE